MDGPRALTRVPSHRAIHRMLWLAPKVCATRGGPRATRPRGSAKPSSRPPPFANKKRVCFGSDEGYARPSVVRTPGPARRRAVPLAAYHPADSSVDNSSGAAVCGCGGALQRCQTYPAGSIGVSTSNFLNSSRRWAVTQHLATDEPRQPMRMLIHFTHFPLQPTVKQTLKFLRGRVNLR